VDDIGLPITPIVTGAHVHDSQVAIPLKKLTERKVQHCYSLMNAAHDANPINNYIRSTDRVSLIDPNKRKRSEQRTFDTAQNPVTKSGQPWSVPMHI
jgi:hypothetical protein